MPYKIIDKDGEIVQEGFKSKNAAINDLFKLKMHKSEKLKVVKYEIEK